MRNIGSHATICNFWSQTSKPHEMFSGSFVRLAHVGFLGCCSKEKHLRSRQVLIRAYAQCPSVQSLLKSARTAPIVLQRCLRIDVLFLRVLLFSLDTESCIIISHAVQDFCEFTQHNNGERASVRPTLPGRRSHWSGEACENARKGDCVFLWWRLGLRDESKPDFLGSPLPCVHGILKNVLQQRKMRKSSAAIYACRFSWLHFLIIIQGRPWDLIAFWILIFDTACLLSADPSFLYFYRTTKRKHSARCLGPSLNHLALISVI